jgi:hypothetical protein
MRPVILLLLLGQGLVGQDTRDVNTLNRKVVRLYNEGKYDEPLAVAERALALNERDLGPGNPATATSLNNLA